MAFSKLTRDPVFNEPSEVQRKVSFDTSAPKLESDISTTVKQQPLTAIESPSFTSDMSSFSALSTSLHSDLISCRLLTLPMASIIPVNILLTQSHSANFKTALLSLEGPVLTLTYSLTIQRHFEVTRWG
jgi:hypothetical protein